MSDFERQASRCSLSPCREWHVSVILVVGLVQLGRKYSRSTSAVRRRGVRQLHESDFALTQHDLLVKDVLPRNLGAVRICLHSNSRAFF